MSEPGGGELLACGAMVLQITMGHGTGRGRVFISVGLHAEACTIQEYGVLILVVSILIFGIISISIISEAVMFQKCLDGRVGFFSNLAIVELYFGGGMVITLQ